MNAKLLPCPFCGGKATDMVDDGGDYPHHSLGCGTCFYDNLTEDEWQHRVYPPEVTAVLEAAKEYRHAQFLDRESLLKLLKAVNNLEEMEKSNE